MSKIKILKNQSGSDLVFGSRVVSNGEQITLSKHYWLDIAEKIEILDLVTSGDIIVNDGTEDLSPSLGREHLELVEGWTKAEDIIFENNSNGFSSDRVQSAIEEVRNSPVGGLDLYEFKENSSANNKWLEYGANSSPSDETPAILPFDAKLISCTFTNDDDGVDTDIEIHKSSEGSGSNASIVATFQIRNRRVARFSDFTAIQFSAGDKISVFARDKGTNPSQVVVKLYFLITNYNKENAGEDFSSDFSLSVGGITITIGS